ncbi:MAG: hypothetical protein LC624_10370 [Halobacteriales archaeon]|nr:hypothetical protein [Halobacteriales archaeon]
MQPSIALATCHELPQSCPDDASLFAGLAQAGIHVQAQPWDAPGVDWAGFDLVLVRAAWDYFLHIDRFRGWLDRCERDGVNLWNPPAVLRWNSDKLYLEELARAGVPTVPMRVVPPDSQDTLAFVMEETGWSDVVVKPAVSGGAWGTFRASAAKPMEHPFAQQKAHGAVLVQPFVAEVRRGEWSFVFFERAFSHAVLKRPGEADFRVQEKHGGTLSPVQASPAQVGQARAVLDAVKGELLYARVDMVDVRGTLTLMELEVLEPELFLRTASGSAERCVAAVRQRLR